MDDPNERAVIGANNPPDPIDTINAVHDDARMESESWLDGKLVTDEKQMNAVDGLRKDMRAWRIALEAGQKDATAPLYAAYTAEMNRWKPQIADAKLIESGLVSLVDGFKKRLADEKESARRAAWAEAEEKRKAAEAIAAAADTGNIEDQRAAVQAREAADLARAQATVAQKDTVKGMRAVTRYEITDHRALLHWIAANDKDAMTAFIEDYARRNHKTTTAGADHGLRVWQDKEAY